MCPWELQVTGGRMVAASSICCSTHMTKDMDGTSVSKTQDAGTHWLSVGKMQGPSGSAWAASVALRESTAVRLTTTDWTCSRANPVRRDPLTQCGQKTSLTGQAKLFSADRGHHVPASGEGCRVGPAWSVFRFCACWLLWWAGPGSLSLLARGGSSFLVSVSL